MFFLPSDFNHSYPFSSDSINASTPFAQVALPHKTPLNVDPASFANLKVSWNISAVTPALKNMNGSGEQSLCSLNNLKASSLVYTTSSPYPSTKSIFTGTSIFNTSTLYLSAENNFIASFTL